MINQPLPNGEYDYWNAPQSPMPQDPVYPPQPMPALVSRGEISREETIIDVVRNLQQSLLQSTQQQQQQKTSPSPHSYSLGQQSTVLPGNGLTVVVETDAARLRITFESK